MVRVVPWPAQTDACLKFFVSLWFIARGLNQVLAIFQPFNVANGYSIYICRQLRIPSQPVCNRPHKTCSFRTTLGHLLRNFGRLTGWKLRAVASGNITNELVKVAIIRFAWCDLKEPEQIAEAWKIAKVNAAHRRSNCAPAAATAIRPPPAFSSAPGWHARLVRTVLALQRRIRAQDFTARLEIARSILAHPAVRVRTQPSRLLMACISILTCGHALPRQSCHENRNGRNIRPFALLVGCAVSDQLAANFTSLMASKSWTPPPTRLVV